MATDETEIKQGKIQTTEKLYVNLSFLKKTNPGLTTPVSSMSRKRNGLLLMNDIFVLALKLFVLLICSMPMRSNQVSSHSSLALPK